jgi:hypothetical protein
MTELAHQFVPGHKPGPGWRIGVFAMIVLWAAIGPLADNLGDYAFAVRAVLVIGAFALYIAANNSDFCNRTERTAWHEKVKMYEDGWICMQCGQSWLPAPANHGTK